MINYKFFIKKYIFIIVFIFFIYFLLHNYILLNLSQTNELRKKVTGTQVPVLKDVLIEELSNIKSKLNKKENKKNCDNNFTTPMIINHNFMSRFKYLNCRTHFNPWKPDGNMPKYDPFIYNYPAPNSTHDFRIVRGVLVYFPIERFDAFHHEIKWLYRSWINMQTYEPNKWRTDLIIFIDKDHQNFKNPDFLLTELNCKFENKRSSPEDKPMCSLIHHSAFKNRNLTRIKEKKFDYNHVLDKIDIFSDEGNDLGQFYSLLTKSLLNYEYLDSILMGFEGFKYFKSVGYDLLIRSDMDVFLTPMFGTWLPINCNDFVVGGGAFSSEFNRKRFKRIARELRFSYSNAGDLGSTWISTPEQFRLVSYLTLFCMAYLSIEEFTEPERQGKVGVLLWPEWHYGVVLLYGQSLALNHLIGSKQLKVVKLNQLIDYPTTNDDSVFKKLHLHVYHSNEMFSKFLFPTGYYDNITVNEIDSNSTKVRVYALRMALEGKRIKPKDLYKKLENDVFIKKI